MNPSYYDDSLTKKRELSAIGTLRHIRQLLGEQRFRNVVDVGAGQGALAGLMSRESFAEEIIALEISSSGLERIQERNQENVKAAAFDGYKSGFADKAFDLALSIQVLEHVEHERLYLQEIARMSKQAVIEVPLDLTANARKVMSITDPNGQINFYQRESFANLLATTGFSIKGMAVNTVTFDLDLYYERTSKRFIQELRTKCSAFTE